MRAPSEQRQNTITIALLATMLTAYAVVSFTAARTKSPTADEPLHWLAGFMRIHYADFRVDAEDPPLAFYWAMLPHPSDVLKVDLTNDAWDQMMVYPWSQWNWVGPTFFRTIGFDPDVYLNRSRAMMTALGVMLGIVIAWWAWALAGRVAALVACGLYCFDPNFLGHAPLVKNDVPIALVFVALAFAIYRAGGRVTILRLIAITLLCAMALTTKFSGVLFVPIMIAMVLSRALVDRPWLVLGRILTSRGQKLLAGCGIIALSAIVSYAGIWASYGFRYSTTRDPELRTPMNVMLIATARNELLIKEPDVVPSEADIAEQAKRPPTVVRLMLWIDRHHLIPEAWTSGFLKTYATTIRRPSFLLNEHRATGWWYYFPLAFLFKTPVATLITLAIAAALVLSRRSKRFDRWAMLCLAIPFAIYGASALTTNLNLGLRHIFPIVPFMFIFAGVAIANVRDTLPRIVRHVMPLLGVVLIIETLAAYPHYIAYFNLPSRAIWGPLNLLGDSNLDWGQDLKMLRDWQQRNPDVELYLDYFGGAEPAYYVKHIGLIDPNRPEVAPAPGALGRDTSGKRKVLAVSASKLQGIYPPYSLWPFYDFIRRQKPIELLGRTIYLYELPFRG